MSKTMLLICFAVASFISGATDQFFYPGEASPPTAIIYAIVAVFLIFLWYRQDSDEIGYPRSRLLSIGIVGFALVALPYYLCRSRGAKRGAVATGLMLLVAVASGALSLAGAYASYYGLQS